MNAPLAAIVLGELALLGLVIWVVAGRMQERARWRMDLQTRLLDRFSSPAELAADHYPLAADVALPGSEVGIGRQR